MSALGYHLVLRLQDDRVIAPSLVERRAVARVLAELSRIFPVLAWKLADTHLHVLLLGDEAAATDLVRRLRILFTRRLRVPVPIEVQRRKPLSGQSHAASTFNYVLRQDEHHGVTTDPFQEASSLSDTLGLRVLNPEIALRVREHLPRMTRASLLRHLGVEELEEACHSQHLHEATLAAFALDRLPKRAEGTEARIAAVAAVGDAVTACEVARALGVTRQCVNRLALASAHARHIRAIRLQMALRAALAASHAGFAPPGPLRATEAAGLSM